MIGRLADGVTPAQAQAELSAIVTRLANDYPTTNKDITPRVVPYNERQNGGPIRTVFWSLMGAVAFVLLIACSNVANLLLARAAHRSREISVRVSLGASRWRIVRQLLVESVLLALISGVFGFALSIVGINLFDAATQDVGKPYYMEFRMDGTVFAFFAAISLATGIIFGLAPALHVSKTNVNEVLKEGGRGMGIGRHPRPALDRRAGRRQSRAHAGAARRCGVHDAQLHGDVPVRSRHRHLAPADDADGPVVSQVPDLGAKERIHQAGRRAAGREQGLRVGGDDHQLPARRRPRHSAHDRRPDQAGRAAADRHAAQRRPEYFDTIGVPAVRGRTVHGSRRNARPGQCDHQSAVRADVLPGRRSRSASASA